MNTLDFVASCVRIYLNRKARNLGLKRENKQRIIRQVSRGPSLHLRLGSGPKNLSFALRGVGIDELSSCLPC